jgi:SMODS and SLOG-associating 2TM effector domain 1
VTPPRDELVNLYVAHRLEDQQSWYERRAAEFRRAGSQLSVLSGSLLAATAVAGVLAGGAVGAPALWAALAVVVPALATAVSAFEGLYAFERHAKIYADAASALRRLRRDAPEAERAGADAFVDEVEAVLRKEQGQWGQLTSEIELPRA